MIRVPTRAPASCGGKVFADDHGVARHDAALEQPEQDRDDVERGQSVEQEVQKQRDRLHHRADQQGHNSAEAIGNEAGCDAADDAERQHQRQHLRTARNAIAEIAAIGDDMDLRHRHRDATGDACDAEQCEQRVARYADIRRHEGANLRTAMGMEVRPAAEHQRQRQHRDHAEDAGRDMGRAPAVAGDEMLNDRRPYRARDIISGGRDRDRDAASLLEPVRHIGDQRTEGRGTAETNQDMRCGKEPQGRCEARADKADAERGNAEQDRGDDSEPVREPAEDHIADGKSHHRHRVGNAGIGAGRGKIGLHSGKRHDIGPHADAADRAKQQRDAQPQPGIARIDEAGAASGRTVHGAFRCGAAQ